MGQGVPCLCVSPCCGLGFFSAFGRGSRVKRCVGDPLPGNVEGLLSPCTGRPRTFPKDGEETFGNRFPHYLYAGVTQWPGLRPFLAGLR